MGSPCIRHSRASRRPAGPASRAGSTRTCSAMSARHRRNGRGSLSAGRRSSSSVPPTCSSGSATTPPGSTPSDSVPREDEMSEDARWLDGNALGGLLQELFGAEMTAAPHTCQSCGAERPVAAHRVYLGAGTVLRCPVCGHVAFVAAALADRHVVYLTGTWRMEMPRS